MRTHPLSVLVAAALLAGPALADGTVTLSLASSKDGRTVAPGRMIDWTISLTVSNEPPGQNAGLAMFAVGLLQDPANPGKLDLPPASGVPTAMANFSRPQGISNPGEGGQTTGYVGVQRGTAGEKNLVQIGGGQNTFGVAGTGMGTNPNLVAGVGHGGPVVVAQGSFAAPAARGAYSYRIDNAVANVLDEANVPPAYSPVSAATIAYSPQTIGFTVGQYGDMDCDGQVTFADIDPFVVALAGEEGYSGLYPNCDWLLADCDGNGQVTFDDIDPFVAILSGGG